MKSVLWQSGQRVIKQVLDWFQEAKDTSILARQDDYTDHGIMVDLENEFDIIVGTNNTPATPSITVRTGVAYDVNSDRINIDDENVSYDAANVTHQTDDGSGLLVNTPRSTGSLNVPLLTNTNNYIWIEYLQTVDDSVFTLHKLFNTKQFYKRTDGYKITRTTDLDTGNTPPSAGALKLGNINLTGGGVVSVSTISLANRIFAGISNYRVKITTALADKTDRTTVYPAGTNIFVDDHVRAVGSGTVSANNPHGLAPTDIGLSPASTVQEHQEFYHTNGLIVPDESSVTSALFPFVTTVDPGLDFVTLRALVGEERVHVGGDTILVSDIPVDVDVLFSVADPNGTWYIYIDRTTRTAAKTQTDILTTPDRTRFLVATIDWEHPADQGAGDGDLTNLVDRRKFGTISTKDIHANAVTPSEIDPSVAGDALSGGNGTPLNVNVDGTSIEVFSDTLRIAAGAAGNGLSWATGVLNVNVDDSTIEIDSDILRVKAGGITGTQLNTSVAGNGLAGGGGSPLSVNVDGTSIEITSDTLRIAAGAAGNGLAWSAGVLSVNAGAGLEIVSDTLRISTAAAGAGLGGGGGSPLSVNVDGSYIVISGDTVTAGEPIKPTRGVRDIGTFKQATDLPSPGTATFVTVYSYSGHGALKGVTWFTNNPGSGGAAFDFRVTLDGVNYDFFDRRTGVNAGQGWPNPNNYATVANGINASTPIGLVSGVDTYSQFYFGFTSSFSLSIAIRAFSDGRWGFTPYVSYERVP
jgi:hypothetical protein